MKKHTISFAAVASIAALIVTTAVADDHQGRRGNLLKKADQNNDGKISLEEIMLHASTRFDKSDADGNGEISVGEMADRIQRERDERRATRILNRMDFNGDGKVTKDELESRARKRFALMDRNDSGFIEEAELRMGRKGMRRHRRHERGDKRRRYNDGDDL